MQVQSLTESTIRKFNKLKIFLRTSNRNAVEGMNNMNHHFDKHIKGFTNEE